MMTAFLPFRQCALCELAHSEANSVRKSGSEAVPADRRPTWPFTRPLPDKSSLIAQRFTPLARQPPRFRLATPDGAASLDRLTLALGRGFAPNRLGHR